MVLNYNAVTTALNKDYCHFIKATFVCMHVHIHNILSSGLSINPPYTCIPVSVLLTYMYRVSIHPSHRLIIVLSPSSSVAVRDENKDEDSDDDNKENEVPQWHLPYAHTYSCTCTVIQRCDYMHMCFCLILLIALIVHVCVHVHVYAHQLCENSAYCTCKSSEICRS